ncbi:hypothetical protein BJ508DRAFT_418703 [Ascobolus immersus RN42]|uniref:Uncharacterized protein n=1 Tax=Ascobolus immersus RN42 TaxID=1160509 RepID=A0A3N4HQD1_ASCIM|nr:hypothetical protein BJ508DRAFT_418703 [Ascobolus immersus RN42]
MPLQTEFIASIPSHRQPEPELKLLRRAIYRNNRANSASFHTLPILNTQRGCHCSTVRACQTHPYPSTTPSHLTSVCTSSRSPPRIKSSTFPSNSA